MQKLLTNISEVCPTAAIIGWSGTAVRSFALYFGHTCTWSRFSEAVECRQTKIGELGLPAWPKLERSNL